MTTTNLLGLPLLEAAQAQKHVTHNEALLLIDALVQLTVLDRDLAAPPATPAEGERYLVAAGASGEWAGQDLKLAVFVDGVWRYLAPAPGWRAWIADEQRLLAWDGTQWRDFADLTGYLGATSLGDGSVNRVGVNGAADTTNRLAVKSDAVLFSHDDVTPGNGDMRATLNKSATAGTASLLFQSGWSGRAEFGLAGSDDFSVKVSADGAAWNEAMKISAATAKVSGISFDATGTGAQSLPIGTTAQRPGAPEAGEIRYNSTDSKVEYYNGFAWVQLEAPAAGSGKLLQVIQSVGTSTPSTASTGFVGSGFSASITPTNATSKIKVTINGAVGGAAALRAAMTLRRNSTDIIPSGSNAVSEVLVPDEFSAVPFSFTYLDSPATTSATTYELSWKVSQSTGYIGRRAFDTALSSSTLVTLEEIGA